MKKDQTCKTPRWRMLKSQLNNISSAEFAIASKAMDSVIIDVRTEKEFIFGHIPNAINIDYMSDDFWDKIELLDASKKYFIYCRSGRRSIRVCTLMRNGGFDNGKVFNLDLGFKDWLEVYPSEVVRPL